MSDSPILSIEIIKEVPFRGEGDTLISRLRNVSLRGFPKVKIYEHATSSEVFLSSDEVKERLHIPQTRVYREPNLSKIGKLASLFKEKGIDVLNLEKAYDYVATHESGEQTEWTMLPPVVERFHIPKSESGGLNYRPLIGRELNDALDSANLSLNSSALNLKHTSDTSVFDLVNDGMHRIFHGVENGGIKIIILEGMTVGFPYYAAPQKYSNLQVFSTREEALKLLETKVHIVQEPGHKNLYRLFPTGNIKSGSVRPH